MKRIAFLSCLVILTLAACGGDDAPTASAGQTATQPPISTGSTDSVVAPSEGPDFAGSPDLVCGRLFSLEEVAGLFGEPAEFDPTSAGFDSSLGSVICNWVTIEDPNDAGDLAVETVTVQVYTGDPIPASAFYDPTLFDNPRPIQGIGDDAFIADLLGPHTAFIDGPVVGSVSYSSFDMGDDGVSRAAGEEQVIEFLRLLHDRVV